jgi:hypothetical protein
MIGGSKQTDRRSETMNIRMAKRWDSSKLLILLINWRRGCPFDSTLAIPDKTAKNP